MGALEHRHSKIKMHSIARQRSVVIGRKFGKPVLPKNLHINRLNWKSGLNGLGLRSDWKYQGIKVKKYSVTNFKFLELFSLSSPMYCAPPRERRVASARLQANSLVFALHFEGQMSANWVTVKLNWTAARLTHILMNKVWEFSVLNKVVEGLGTL